MSGPTEMRFSDQELVDLRKEFTDYQLAQESRWEQFGQLMTENTRVTSELALSMSKIADSTKGVVQLYQDVQGVARLGDGLQKFLLWLAKWGVIGSALTYGIRWLAEHFNR